MTLHITKKYNITKNDIVINLFDNYNINIDTLNKFLSILNLDEIKSIYDYFKTFLNNLKIYHENDIDTVNLLSKKQKIDYNNYLKERLKKSSHVITNYFFKIFKERLEFFKKIKPLCFDNIIQDLPVYKHNSKTGRAYIKEGFNYMTLKKIDRKRLSHPDVNRVLLEIDFISCEPSFYLKQLGYEFNNDVYEHIAHTINLKIENRENFKRSIISILYGADFSTIKKLSKISKDEYKLIKKLLRIEEFKKELIESFEKNKFLKNFYGRPILFDNNLINYWIQSSVADYCCLAFNQMLENNQDVELHAFIHDAIIVSCPKQTIDKLSNISFLFEKESNISLNIKITLLSS